MIASPHHSGRGGKQVRLVVIHTAEGARTKEALGRFFQNPKTQASSHVGIDDTGIEQYVPYDRAAWTLRNGNAISDNAELCGFAKWGPAEWAAHESMLAHAAAWVRERCLARGIPMDKLTPQQVAAGQAGVISHDDWTKGMKDGSHWDPGPDFPWTKFMQMVRDGGITLSWNDELTPVVELGEEAEPTRPAWRWLTDAAVNSWKVLTEFRKKHQSRYTDPDTGERSTYEETLVGFVLNADASSYGALVQIQAERKRAEARHQELLAKLDALGSR